MAPENVQYLPRTTSAPEGAYKAKFTSYMSGMNSSMAAAKKRVDQMFAAQCLKDDKMSESIVDYLAANPDKIVFHVNGSFHSDAHLGTVERVKLRDNTLKLAVISPKYMGVEEDYLAKYMLDKNEGEYIIYFVREEKDDEKK